MKRRKIMLGALLLMSGVAFSQVGVGIKEPHKSTLLHLVNKKDDYKGLFVPNVPLRNSKDASIINNGDILNSLLIYNTATIESEKITPGFYYWKGAEWVRVVDSKDILDNLDSFPRNEVMRVEGEELVLKDTKGGIVKTPIKDLNIVTTITALGDGKYEYKNEAGTIAIIDVKGSVIDNITEILQDNSVKQEIYNTVAAQGKPATPKDDSIVIDNGGKAVLNPMQIAVADGGITTGKIKPGTDKYLLVTKNGKVEWVPASDDIIKDAVKSNEKVTILDDNKNGTFTYYNENAIDPKTGAIIKTKGITFDANTLRIKEREGKKEKGIYDFYDGLTSLKNPLITISTRASSIHFDNETNIIPGDNLQVVIDNIINKIEIAQNKPADLKGDGISINGNTVLGGAVLKEVLLTITDGAITSEKIKDSAVTTGKLRNAAVTPIKIAPGDDKQLLVTKNGVVDWVPATDSVIKEVVEQNEVVTVIVNNNNGTYSYYNEKSIDKNGNPITGKGQLIDANTLSITDDAKGKYVFTDGEKVVGTIDILATVITNIDEILNNAQVQNAIYTTVANKGQELKGDKAINVAGVGKAVLSEATLSLNDNSIEAGKLEAGAPKTFLVTNTNGEVKWISGDDQAINDILKLKETTTVLDITKKAKGIYTYYNEEAVKNSTAGVEIDVNSLTIDDNKKGVYVFKDLSDNNPLATIDIPQNVIDNISVILNNTDVKNEITNIVKTNAKDISNTDASILIETGKGAVLTDTKISVAPSGVKTAHIDQSAVTTEKIATKAVTETKIAGGAPKTFLVTTGNGEVKWISGDDQAINDILKLKETNTVLEDHKNGTFTYKSETDIKEGKAGVTFDANTLKIVETPNGVYNFYDKRSDTKPIGIVNVPASVISNINTILNDESVKLTINNIVKEKAQKVESTDSSIAVTGGDKAALSHLTLNVAEGGVTTNKMSSKVQGVNAAKGTVLSAEGDGTVAFKTATESVAPAMKGNLVGEDNVIHVEGGSEVLFGDKTKKVTVSIVEGGITSKHIQDGTIVNGDIASKTIKVEKLDATGKTAGHIATVNADGTVGYQALTPAVIADKGDITVNDGITVDNGTGKVLANITLGLADGKVTPAKLKPGTDKFLLVTKNGKADWVAATDAIIDDAVKHNETITVLENKGKGIYNYKNESDVKNNGIGVNIDVNSLTIDNSKPGVYVFKDLSDNNPLATIDIAQNVINSIVTIVGDTNVKEEVYKIIAAQGKAITSTDGSLAIPANNKAGLEGLNMGIAKDGVKSTHIAAGQVDATKLVATATQEGYVATVNVDGTVSYKSLTSAEVTNKAAALKTDGIIQVGGVAEQAGTLFKEATLSIKPKGIDTAQLADGAVTNDQIAAGAVTVDKISAGNEPPKRVMVIDDNGVVKWGELDDIVTDAAGNLTTDNIIEITKGDGVNSLFNDVTLGIKEKSITNQKIADQTIEIGKLSNIGSQPGMVMVTNANGGFTYVDRESIVQAGEDLTLGAGLEFTVGNGQSAVLADTGIKIKDKGVTTTQLADGAVKVEQMSSLVGANNAEANTVLTAKGDGTVEYKKMNSAAFEGAGADLASDGSLLIPADNKAALKPTTIVIATDGVQTQHIAANAVTTAKIADEHVTIEKIKGGAVKQLLITNDGGKAEWADATSTIIKEIVDSNESITLLTDHKDGTFTYQNEKDIKEGTAGVRFSANTLTITERKDAAGKETGIFDFFDKSKTTPIATINVSATVINNIKDILLDPTVKNEIYNTVAAQGKTVSTDDSITVVGGEKATLSPMTISLKDGGVTTKKITSVVNGNNSADGTVLTADGAGNVVFKKLDEVAATQGKAITSTGKSLEIAGNKAALQGLNIEVAKDGIKSAHIAEKQVTIDKIGANNPKGQVLTSNGQGSVEFVSLGTAVESNAKNIVEGEAITVVGGDKAVLKEVTIGVTNGGITEEKLGQEAVTRTKIKNKEITAAKMAGEKKETILVTDNFGEVKWADANETIIKDIIRHNESSTVLRDNGNGTFTYFNEEEVDNKGNIKDKAKGITFDANTLNIDNSKPGVYVFKDKLNGGRTLATIDTRASKIIFEGDVKYDNVEQAITEIITKIEQIEKIEIAKAPLSGNGILVNGKNSEADVVFKKVELSIADNAVTTAKVLNENITTTKIKGGVAKQLLVTDDNGKAKWVYATDDIIKDAVQTQERITLLEDNKNGTFTYFNENDVDNEGNKIGTGITFNANTLRIEVVGKGKYEFHDKADNSLLGTIDVTADIIENILEVINDISVKEEIYKVIAAQGKKVSTDDALEVTGGDHAVLNDITLSLKNEGVTTEKIKEYAVTEDKLFAGEGKTNYVPVVQGDGSVKYQPMTAVVTGQMLNVDSSLTAVGETSRALLEKLDLKVSDAGIGTEHIKPLAVTVDKMSSKKDDTSNYGKGEVLIADGSGNVGFVHANEVVNKATQGDLVGEKDVITVVGGENVLFGDENTKVNVSINKGGIKGGKDGHIAAGTIVDSNITDKTISAAKLDGGTAVEGAVATVNADKTISYKPLTPAAITGKGSIVVTDGITVDNGVDKVLADVTLGIANNSIKVEKFDADGAVAGSVPMVSADGKAVTYQPLTADKITTKGNINTDGVIIASDNGVDKVLADVTLGIKPEGIDTTHLANGAVKNAQIDSLAVTVDKISALNVGEKRVMVSQDDGTVIWGELGDIVGKTAGDLTTDGIITMSTNGKETVLKDVTLGIKNNSITKEKLSSMENGVPIGQDKILVSNAAGGFDLVDQAAVQVGGKDLKVGNALEFTKGDGLNTVLVETTIDLKKDGVTTEKIKDAAVTVEKMNSGAATANMVLTAKGGGKVAYEALSSTAFDGKGANLLSDSSIKVVAGNQALLKETNIGIAENGVKTVHIDDKQVSVGKINPDKATQGMVLTVDDKGNAAFQTLDKVSTTQGKAVASTDGSLTVTDKNKAALQDLTINVAQGGIKGDHIGTGQVTADKIGSGENGAGMLLTTDGQGGAAFKNAGDALSSSAKELKGGTGITISGTGATKALLGDATVAISDRGVDSQQLAKLAVKTENIADKNVTAVKMSSNDGKVNATTGYVLTADGNGGAKFEVAKGNTTTGSIQQGNTIHATSDATGAVLKDVKLEVRGLSLDKTHLKDSAVTNEKIADGAVKNAKIGLKAVQVKNMDDLSVSTRTIEAGAVTNEKIANLTIDNTKIKNTTITGSKLVNGAVSTTQIKDKAVSPEKLSSTLSSGNVAKGYVLTSDGNGYVTFEKATGTEVAKKNITESSTIEAVKGWKGSVMEEVQLDIKKESIKSSHIGSMEIKYENMDHNSVGYEELREESVGHDKIKIEGVEQRHISSKKFKDSSNYPSGYVLTADGDGGATWEEVKTPADVKAAMPKFFYAPSFYVTVEPGKTYKVNIYDFYKEQFGSPKAINSNAQKQTLPVLDSDELDYYVIYFDEDVIDWVNISNDGVLEYKVERNADIGANTYFNIVFGVRE